MRNREKRLQALEESFSDQGKTQQISRDALDSILFEQAPPKDAEIFLEDRRRALDALLFGEADSDDAHTREVQRDAINQLLQAHLVCGDDPEDVATKQLCKGVLDEVFNAEQSAEVSQTIKAGVVNLILASSSGAAGHARRPSQELLTLEETRKKLREALTRSAEERRAPGASSRPASSRPASSPAGAPEAPKGEADWRLLAGGALLLVVIAVVLTLSGSM